MYTVVGTGIFSTGYPNRFCDVAEVWIVSIITGFLPAFLPVVVKSNVTGNTVTL